MIGNKIKELRKIHELTLEELADSLNKKYPNTVNFNKGKISKWENNKEEPRLSSVKILADFFNVPLDFFNDENINQPQILSIYNQLEQPRQEK
ncbi:helix-turn-helix transcriptional regulator, partial [Streptococcus anginosus]